MKKNIRIVFMMALAMLCIVIGSVKIQAADVALKNGKWANRALEEETTEQYYKINIKKTGYIKIEYVMEDRDAYVNMIICNGNKKAIQEVDLDSKTTSYFAVRKGIYYLCISGSIADTENEGDNAEPAKYKVRYAFTAMKETKNPTSMKNADTLKKNKQVSGLVFSAKKGKDIYYKFTVEKKSKVKFEYEVRDSYGLGFLTLQILDKKGKLLRFNAKGNVIKNKDMFLWWEGKGSDFVILPKGTYYFRISPIAGSSGYYKLQLK